MTFYKETKLVLGEPRLIVVYDKWNQRAAEYVANFEKHKHRNPNCVLVAGGDGKMLHTIPVYRHREILFYGVNYGHKGFLMNDLDSAKANVNFWERELTIHHLPCLEVEITKEDGQKKKFFAFQDAWVERGPHTTWIKVVVNGVTQVDKLVGDGALVATPQGTTAYAKGMGAPPLPLDAKVLTLVGSNIAEPDWFKAVHLPINTVVEFHCIDPLRRPMRAVTDGIRRGKVKSMRISIDNSAIVKLAVDSDYDLARKLANVQFKK